MQPQINPDPNGIDRYKPTKDLKQSEISKYELSNLESMGEHSRRSKLPVIQMEVFNRPT